MANEKLIDANKYPCRSCGKTYCHQNCKEFIEWLENPVDAVEVEKYEALVEMYHDLRENFIDYVCSGTHNLAPYCLNRCEGCVDRVGWCSQGSDECHGFNPAEVILDDAKMDGDRNG